MSEATGMEHAIEQAAGVMDKNFNPDRYPIMAAMFRDYARALADAGLLAPAPLTEEWACRYTLKSGRVMTRHEDTEAAAREWMGAQRSTIIRRHVTAWELHEPVDRAEGDGRAEQ